MSVTRSMASFLQSSLLGGTYDDLAFELRVLKGEMQSLHERLDREMDAIKERLDRLEGKPGKGRGRSRLTVMSPAETADAAASEPVAPPPSEASAAFAGSMTVLEAHRMHPEVQAVFARNHLPGCTDCAVSAGETLADAAAGHGIDAASLLKDLNALSWN